MRYLTRVSFWARAAGVGAAMLVLSGCPGEKSDPQPQTPAARAEAMGIVTDGISLRAQPVAGKGAAGLTRLVTSSASGAFKLSLTDLTGPYFLANALSVTGNTDLLLLTTLTTKEGTANLTPLTTLLTAQLLGVTPANAFSTFASVPKGQVTDANIRSAQAELTDFLQDVLGVQVRSGNASFVDTSFSPSVGDAMFDTILALNAKIAADGTTLEALSSRIATGVQACVSEHTQISLNGRPRKFCPVSKSATPEDADPSILDYVFRNVSNEVLTVKVRANTVLSVDFTNAAEAVYSCGGASCASITLGAPADDQSRPITFASAALTGGGSGAIIDGTLVGPTPSITLPTLPCTDNRYFLIRSDNTVVANCIAGTDPFQLGGSFLNGHSPGRNIVSFSNVQVVLDTSAPEPKIVSVYYSETDPDTFEARNRFVCQLSACNGVTFGLETITTSPGFPIGVRNISFNNTLLTGLNADGTATGITASFRGSFVLLRDPSAGTSQYPAFTDCDPATDTVFVSAPGGADFNLCMPQNDTVNGFFYRNLFDLGGGLIQIQMFNDFFDQVIVDIQDGVLVDATVALSSTGEPFVCSKDCSGITVTAPEDAGGYVISFSNAVLHRQEAFPLPSDLTVTVTSGDLVVPPP